MRHTARSKAVTIRPKMVSVIVSWFSFGMCMLTSQSCLGIYPDPLPGGFNGPESCGIVKPANVISTSYASDESDLTPFYAIRQCNEYGKLGLMGVTILYSSGDQGVAGNGGRCLNPDGKQSFLAFPFHSSTYPNPIFHVGTQSTNGTRFNPLFPAVCPFVTAVGATQVNPNSTVFEPEGACEQVIFSGGGFSNVFKRPSFQDAAVQSFLTNHPPPFTSAQFNTSGVSFLRYFKQESRVK